MYEGESFNYSENEQEQTRKGKESKTRSFERTYFLNDPITGYTGKYRPIIKDY